MADLTFIPSTDRELVEALESAAWPETTKATTLMTVRAFSRWLDSHPTAAHDGPEQAMLRWAHEQYPDRAWATIHARFHALHRYALMIGVESPFGLRARKYLQALRRDVGTRKADRTDPIRVEEAEAIAETLDAPPLSERDYLLQAAIVLSWATGLPLLPTGKRAVPDSSTATLSRERLSIEADRIVISVPGRPRVVIDAGKTPALHGLVQRAFEGQALTGAVLPIRKGPDVIVKRLWDRMGLPGNPRDMDCLSGMSPEDVFWVAACVDRYIRFRLRDTAYVLVGVLLARRHEQLERLRLCDLMRKPDAYEVYFPKSKTDQEGKGLVKGLPHGRPGEPCTTWAPCHPCCPVRALDDLVEVERRYWGRTEGPLFATLHDGEIKSLDIRTAQYRLENLWKQAGLDESAKIGTRSLRVGGATSGRERGMTIAQIATELTDHKTYSVAEVYVRRATPYASTLQLHPGR